MLAREHGSMGLSSYWDFKIFSVITAFAAAVIISASVLIAIYHWVSPPSQRFSVWCMCNVSPDPILATVIWPGCRLSSQNILLRKHRKYLATSHQNRHFSSDIAEKWHRYWGENVTLKAIILKGFRSSVYISTNSFLMMQLAGYCPTLDVGANKIFEDYPGNEFWLASKNLRLTAR